MTPFDMVREFHLAYGVDAPTEPRELQYFRQKLRFKLIDEEFNEYQDAAASGDMQEIAKELADLMYVVVGAAVEHGLMNFDAIFAEVHRSNMSKLGDDGKPIHREDGKVLKGPNYRPADLTAFIGQPTARPAGSTL